jgi:hypothetical protein
MSGSNVYRNGAVADISFGESKYQPSDLSVLMENDPLAKNQHASLDQISTVDLKPKHVPLKYGI